ncbi:MAG TPA: NUDIX domain-containing protein [Firmicutes bacterium]|nr:NUDIX domain-containing protein [Bacillota bacterium]
MIIERNAVRAILLAPLPGSSGKDTSAAQHQRPQEELQEELQVLLMKVQPPQGRKTFWITPGGGMEEGESAESCLRRELQEELGITEMEIGPLVWRRQHTFTWGEKRYCQRENIYIVRTRPFVPHISDAVEAKVLQCFRWWPLVELSRTTETLTPLSLAEIIQRYLREGAPKELPEMEVLVD